MLSEKDIERFRSETPGTKEVIHFNNAGSSLPPEVVRKAVNDYNNEEMTFG
ncbi:MAG: selenocysteine lyase/cysteine desulfurase, partial [Roseivirga sp.]